MTSEQMVMGVEAFDCGIQKRLIHAGKKQVDYVDGTKVYFHFKTIIQEDGTVLDDSKKLNEPKPMELIIGKKFKMEIWEKALRTMWLNEVARFSVVKELLLDYPIVAKQLRDYYETLPSSNCAHSDKDQCKNHTTHKHEHKTEGHRQHCCGFNAMEHGIGYSDLDKLIKEPKSLDFIFEVIKVEQPGEYKKDGWILTDAERVEQIPILKKQGNEMFQKGDFPEACKKYEEALGFLEQFMLKEKPNDVEWNEFNEQKIPILLNFSLCKFNLKEFYACIEHTNTILESQPKNVKALYRRAKAQAAVWNMAEARQDFEVCRQLDASLSKDIDAQLARLLQLEQEKNKKDRELFKGKF